MTYETSINEFTNKKELFHFTSFNTATIILDTMRLQLSKIEKTILDDPKEIDYLNPFFKGKVFIACFTGTISDRMWDEYTKKEGKEKGVCIKIENVGNELLSNEIQSKKGDVLHPCNKTSIDYEMIGDERDWGIYNNVGLKVDYVDNPLAHYTKEDDMIEFFSNCVNLDPKVVEEEFTNVKNSGFVKEKSIWEWEDEYRIRCTLRPKGDETYFKDGMGICYRPTFNYIYMDLSKIKHRITICVDKKNIKKNDLRDLCKKKGVKFKVL